MPEPITDTLTALIDDIAQRVQRLGGYQPTPDDPAVVAWLRALLAQGDMVLVVPRTGDAPRAQNSDLGLTLRDLAAVADGEVRGGPESDEIAVQDMIQTIAESLFSRAGTAAYDVPADWWASGIGRLCRLALAVAEGDDALITIAEAAQQLGVSIQAVTRAIATGKLRAVANPEAVSSQRGARLVFADEVARWQREREGR